MIRPTLFVGLGTTGTNIIKYLRRFIFEEYGRAGLPVFRYVSIETDGAENGEDPGLRVTSRMESYEQIRVIKATIASTKPIEHKITPGDPLYDKNLASWLNPDLLKIGDRSFEAGAKNIRMAGRLCLWENWVEVENTLRSEANSVNASANVEATKLILKKHNAKKRGTISDRQVDPDTTDVYVFGSLCGGSCSGMWIDIAYFFRSLFATTGKGSSAPKLYGIFTMFDKEQATNLRNQVRTANCYGALHEYNFYNHIDTSYSMVLPTGHEILEIKDPPFDYTLFESRSGKNSSIRFNKPDGSFDEEGLNQMVALNLFADVSGDSDGMKNAIRTDWYGHDGYRQIKPRRDGETNVMVRCMASFGLTAVWYPKYRIATGAACLIGQKLCENWLGSHQDNIKIKEKGSEKCNAIIEKHIDRLTSPPSDSPIKRELDALLVQARRQFPNAKSARDFENMMRNFPHGASFHNKFDKGKDYCNLIEQLAPDCRQAMIKEITSVFKEQLNMLTFNEGYGMGDVHSYFKALDHALEKYLEHCPARFPILSLDSLDFSKLRAAEENMGLKLVGLQKKSTEQHQNQLIKTYTQIIEQMYFDLRNHYLRPIIEDMRMELGFLLENEDKDEMDERKTIQSILHSINQNLRELIEQFKADYREAVDVPKQINVAIVANNPDNLVEVDMKRLAYLLNASEADGDLLEDRSLSDFLSKADEAVHVQMKEVYRRYALAKIEDLHVVSKAQEMLNQTRSSPIEAVARRATPCQTFNNLYQELHIPTAPNMISGQDTSGNVLKELKVNLSQEGHEFARIGSTTVDHLLFFYTEEAGFAVNDLESFRMLHARYNEKPGPYGHLTRHDARYYDLELAIKKKQLDLWMTGLCELTPLICRYKPAIFDHVLRDGGTDEARYVYAIDGGLGSEVYLQGDPEGVITIAQQENTPAYQWFMHHINSGFRLAEETFVNRLVNEVLDSTPRNKRESRRKFFKEFLHDVFSEIWLQTPDFVDPTLVNPPQISDEPSKRTPDDDDDSLSFRGYGESDFEEQGTFFEQEEYSTISEASPRTSYRDEPEEVKVEEIEGEEEEEIQGYSN